MTSQREKKRGEGGDCIIGGTHISCYSVAEWATYMYAKEQNLNAWVYLMKL